MTLDFFIILLKSLDQIGNDTLVVGAQHHIADLLHRRMRIGRTNRHVSRVKQRKVIFIIS